MTLFNRIVSVIVGPEGSEQGLKVERLKVVFNVKKTNKEQTNQGNITIYNLSRNTRENFINFDDLIILNAGYADATGLEQVFVGNITNINHIKEGADILTKIEAEDGGKALRETKVSISYKEGKSAKDILKDVIKLLPLRSQNIDFDAIIDSEFVHGFSNSGLFKNTMEKLVKKLGLDWSVQDNELQVLKKKEPNQDLALKISPETGLIGSPEKIQNLDEDEDDAAKRPGWKVKSLLFPKISVAGLVSVESREIKPNSFFRVVTVEHSGDTFGQDWNTVSEIEERK